MLLYIEGTKVRNKNVPSIKNAVGTLTLVVRCTLKNQTHVLTVPLAIVLQAEVFLSENWLLVPRHKFRHRIAR